MRFAKPRDQHTSCAQLCGSDCPLSAIRELGSPVSRQKCGAPFHYSVSAQNKSCKKALLGNQEENEKEE